MTEAIVSSGPIAGARSRLLPGAAVHASLQRKVWQSNYIEVAASLPSLMPSNIYDFAPEFGIDMAVCFSIYDWDAPAAAVILDLAEALFARFAGAPFEATGSLGDKKSHGSYSRVQRKIRAFLDPSNPPSVFRDARVLSDRDFEASSCFCPSRLGMSLADGSRASRKAMFYLRPRSADEAESFIKEIESQVIPHFGTFYGAVFYLPVRLGPECYLSSIVALHDPENRHLREYAERIKRWRDRTYAGVFSSDGYFREIYPINYLNDRHLGRSLKGRRLKEIAGRIGTLSTCGGTQGMFRWMVEPGHLAQAREEMEASGLILSAAIAPLANPASASLLE